MIYRFDTLGSTNDEAMSDKYSNGDIIVAARQTSGRGQRGNRWLSGEGLNLTLSSIFCPQSIELTRQFLISQSVALAICDTLQSYGLEPRIKWTNDIYIGEKKICGVLIENRLKGLTLCRSVVGIGLNVNQELFDPELPNPTSMAIVAGQKFDRDDVLERLSAALQARYAALDAALDAQIVERYHSLMYRRGELHPFRLPSEELRHGTILGVAPSGELQIEWESGESASYLFGAIEFVIESRKR